MTPIGNFSPGEFGIVYSYEESTIPQPSGDPKSRATTEKFCAESANCSIALPAEVCDNEVGPPEVQEAPKKEQIVAKRIARPYKEYDECVDKPRSVRVALLVGHMNKEAELARLDEIVEKHADDPEELVNAMGKWMIGWINTLGCNAVDLEAEYRTLAADTASNLTDWESIDPSVRGHNWEERREELVKKLAELREGMKRNEKERMYWSEMANALDTPMHKFLVHFRVGSY